MSEPEQRTYDVAMSVEALASAWARTEGAPAGSVVVAESEVSGRLRGGTPWTRSGPESLSMAIVVRPKIAPMQEALLWTVAAVSAADALTIATGVEHGVLWPDRAASTGGEPVCFVNVQVQLRPGAIDHAVFAFRADLRTLKVDAGDRGEFVHALADTVQQIVNQLEDHPLTLLASFNERCLLRGELVVAKLLPRGQARGRATAVDSDGFFVLESATGMLERIAPASLRSLDLADPRRL